MHLKSPCFSETKHEMDSTEEQDEWRVGFWFWKKLSLCWSLKGFPFFGRELSQVLLNFLYCLESTIFKRVYWEGLR